MSGTGIGNAVANTRAKPPALGFLRSCALVFTLLLLGLSCLCLQAAWDDEPTREVRGLVTDSNTKPLTGACVRIKGTTHQTTTDATGRFHLRGQGQRVTAWKEGYFIGGVPVDQASALLLRLRRLPQDDNPEYNWVEPTPNRDAPQHCGNCHGQIYREWAGSAHGRAGENRHFRNLYDGTDWEGRPNRGWNLRKEHPEGVSVCAGCHAPTVKFEDPAYEDFRQLRGVDRRGVHCDYCHKIVDVSLSRLGQEHGRFSHQLLRPSTGQLFFGPLDDVDRDEDAYSPLYKESRYCASCHEGTVFGAKVYTTYSEWLASPAKRRGQQCQSCHMAPTGQMTNIAPGRGGMERDPKTLGSHGTPGGDLAMLRRCLALKTTLRRDGPALHVTCTVTATNVGHRVPTGFIDRNLSLVVEPMTTQGHRLAPTSGPTLPAATGVGNPGEQNFAGLPGRFYAKLIADSEGQVPIPFWRFAQDVADTRLHPEQPDTTTWVFPAEQVVNVRVRLIYRRFFKLTADQKSWPRNDIVVIEETLPVPR